MGGGGGGVALQDFSSKLKVSIKRGRGAGLECAYFLSNS